MKRMQKKLKGLSLLEVMVSMGIFSIMMVAVSGIFSSSMTSSRANRVIEHNLENAQFVMNEIAKELRTSTIVNPSDASFGAPVTQDAIRFFDYSQGLCIAYTKTTVDGNNVIQFAFAASAAPGQSGGCDSSTSLSTPITKTTGDVVPKFRIVTSSNGTVGGVPNPRNARVGFVTMLFTVKEKASASQNITLQTSVSLRDYVNSGIVH